MWLGLICSILHIEQLKARAGEGTCPGSCAHWSHSQPGSQTSDVVQGAGPRSSKKSKASKVLCKGRRPFQEDHLKGCPFPSQILNPLATHCLHRIGSAYAPGRRRGLRQDRGVTHFCLTSQEPKRLASRAVPQPLTSSPNRARSCRASTHTNGTEEGGMPGSAFLTTSKPTSPEPAPVTSPFPPRSCHTRQLSCPSLLTHCTGNALPCVPPSPTSLARKNMGSAVGKPRVWPHNFLVAELSTLHSCSLSLFSSL